MLIVAKAESRSRRERHGYIDQLMEISPRFNFAHEMMVESLLPRWGGRPGDIAQYAAQVADKIGGDDGDVLYARLVIGVIFYEGELAAEPFTGLDFDRAIRGAEHMQKSPALRPLGTLYALRLAHVCADKDRVARVIATIDQEIGDMAVDRRTHLGAREVELGHAERGDRLIVGCLRRQGGAARLIERFL